MLSELLQPLEPRTLQHNMQITQTGFTAQQNSSLDVHYGALAHAWEWLNSHLWRCLSVHCDSLPALQHVDRRRPVARHAAGGTPPAAPLRLWRCATLLWLPHIRLVCKLSNNSSHSIASAWEVLALTHMENICRFILTCLNGLTACSGRYRCCSRGVSLSSFDCMVC
jgi:hypothetical protein